MRSSPTRFRMAFATVVLPEPVPPATPIVSGDDVTRGPPRPGPRAGRLARRGSSLEGLEHLLRGGDFLPARVELDVLGEVLLHVGDLVEVHARHPEEEVGVRVVR